jgi:hypothetical protein
MQDYSAWTLSAFDWQMTARSLRDMHESKPRSTQSTSHFPPQVHRYMQRTFRTCPVLSLNDWHRTPRVYGIHNEAVDGTSGTQREFVKGDERRMSLFSMPAEGETIGRSRADPPQKQAER